MQLVRLIATTWNQLRKNMTVAAEARECAFVGVRERDRDGEERRTFADENAFFFGKKGCEVKAYRIPVCALCCTYFNLCCTYCINITFWILIYNLLLVYNNTRKYVSLVNFFDFSP